MGFLEELKKETEAEQAKQRIAKGSTEARAAEFIQAAQGTMRSLYDYLHNLAEHLNRAPPDVPVSYEVQGCNGFTALGSGDFKASIDDPKNIQLCTLRYACRRDRDLEFYTATKESGERQQQYLWQHKLQFSSHKTPDDRMAFVLESYVPITFEFGVEAAKRTIRLKVTNHETLGSVSYSYDRDDINSLYLDELARFIMRKPSRFHELSGDVVPEDTLAKLRQQVADRKAERAKELGKLAKSKVADPQKKGLFKGLFKK